MFGRFVKHRLGENKKNDSVQMVDDVAEAVSIMLVSFAP
jgi:hypothetical protein